MKGDPKKSALRTILDTLDWRHQDRFFTPFTPEELAAARAELDELERRWAERPGALP